jgi:hypothetical protein
MNRVQVVYEYLQCDQKKIGQLSLPKSADAAGLLQIQIQLWFDFYFEKCINNILHLAKIVWKTCDSCRGFGVRTPQKIREFPHFKIDWQAFKKPKFDFDWRQDNFGLELILIPPSPS